MALFLYPNTFLHISEWVSGDNTNMVQNLCHKDNSIDCIDYVIGIGNRSHDPMNIMNIQ